MALLFSIRFSFYYHGIHFHMKTKIRAEHDRRFLARWSEMSWPSLMTLWISKVQRNNFLNNPHVQPVSFDSFIIIINYRTLLKKTLIRSSKTAALYAFYKGFFFFFFLKKIFFCLKNYSNLSSRWKLCLCF
jgi:hypothetical protein